MEIRAAAPGDGVGMLRLMESHHTEGGMRLVFTRRPDAYRSYQTECAGAEMTVCVDSGGTVLAQVTCLPRKLYMDREIQTVGYVTGLHKTTGAYVNIIELLETARDRSAASLFFCSILDDNDSTFRSFAKRGLIRPMCGYTTYFLNPSAIKKVKHDYIFRRATSDDEARLLRFYNSEGARYSFFPVLSSVNDYPGLTVPGFFLLEDEDGIVAACALWDQRAFKQYHALGYSGIYKLAARCSPLLRALRYPPLPGVNAAANFAYVSFLLSRGGDPATERALLGEVAASARGYDFLTIGAPINDDLGVALGAMRGIRIGSSLCLIAPDKSGITTPLSANPRFECAFL